METYGNTLNRDYKHYYSLIMAVPLWKERALELGLNEKAYAIIDDSFNVLNFDQNSEDLEKEKSKFLSLCFNMLSLPDWKQYAQEKGYFAQAIENGSLAMEFDQNRKLAETRKFWGWHPRDYNQSFLPAVLSVPEWRQYMLESQQLDKMLEALFSNYSKGKSLMHFSNEKNDPAKTFMFMLRVFSNEPEFRDSFTPYMKEALELAGGKDAFFKGRYKRNHNIAFEILKYARQYHEWYKAISTEDVSKTLEKADDFNIPNIMSIAKGKAMKHWQQAIIHSENVKKLVNDELDQPHLHGRAMKVVNSFELYKKALKPKVA